MLEINHFHDDQEQLENTMELLHPNWKRSCCTAIFTENYGST